VLRGPELVYELVNPSYEVLLGHRPLLGLPIGAAIPELDPRILDILQKVVKTGEPFRATELLIPLDRDDDGVPEDAWFNLLFHPLQGPDSIVSGIVAVAIEVTEHLRAREELERVNRGLEEFAHVASHDLQEPLRMVHSYSQLLVRRLGKDVSAEQRKYAEFIQQGVKRMENLIGDLLTYSRTVYAAPEAVGQASLDEALDRALAAVQTSMDQSGATISRERLPTVRGDAAQFAHVFQNLLSNSLKYRKPDKRPEIRIRTVHVEDEWTISVQDNGIGFEPRQAQNVFGLFKRLHRDDEYPGTGLGLAICKRIVERYGGRIWAESEPGEGSTFFFSLPALKA
jgi:light-regulated signal transduction histidine kinase (bacteriophytochrome)